MMFKDTGFMQYQLVQTSESSVLARAIRGYQGTTADTRDRQHVLKALRSHLGERIQIDWQFVDSIPVPLSGKHQLLVSEVADRTLQLETRKAIQRHAATIEPSSN
jgi:hypothetical protein